MFRIIGFIQAKDGMSQEEFKSYYENKHHPLMRRLLPTKREHERNYLALHDPVSAQIATELSFNVVVQVVFDSEEDYRLFREAYVAHSVEIAADEAKFVKSKRSVVVEQLRTAKAAKDGEPVV